MFSLSIKTNFPQVERSLNQLRGDLGKTVLVRSVNRTMEQGRTAMSREIRGEYNVTAGYVRERLQLRKASYRAGRFQVVATLSGSGKSGAKRAASCRRTRAFHWPPRLNRCRANRASRSNT